MSIQPLITFKAGKCSYDSSNKPHVTTEATPGYIYLYMEEDFVHFCWRPRSAPVDQPELDLFMLPADGTFKPYVGKSESSTTSSSNDVRSPTNGRIFALKFSSSSQRYFFWLQSKAQHPSGSPSAFSERDLKLGDIVNSLLSGEEVDMQAQLAELRGVGRGGGGGRDEDPDEDMTDAPPEPHGRDRRASTGGAGPDATGGDIREEGEEAREGGADGGRAASSTEPTSVAATDPSSIVQNFLNSLKSGQFSQQSQQQKPGPTLPDLLTPETTLPVLATADSAFIDTLTSHLPPILLLLAQAADSDSADEIADLDPAALADPDIAQAAVAALSEEQKRSVLEKVLRSPQLTQSLASLTAALRDGGLPMIAQSVEVKVANGGLIRGGQVPLDGAAAVEAFLEGVKGTVSEEEGKGEEGRSD